VVTSGSGGDDPVTAAAVRAARDLHPEQIFGLGISLGVVLGFVLGALAAWRFGDEAWDGIHGLIERITGRDDGINFELLLQ
jgi:hypothetical protein